MMPKLCLELLLGRKSVFVYLEITKSNGLKDIGTYFDVNGKNGNIE